MSKTVLFFFLLLVSGTATAAEPDRYAFVIVVQIDAEELFGDVFYRKGGINA